MKEAIWSRVGPAAGLLFFPVLMVGFFIHRYPDIRPSDAQLASWLATVNLSTFRFGVYVEALGIMLLIPFAAWLYFQLRQGARDASWPAVAMLAAAIGWVVISLQINEAWVGLLDQARNGLDIRVAQTVVSINQATYDMTGVVHGVTILAAGVAIVRGGAMARWVGWAAVIIGVFLVGSVPFGIDATPFGILGYIWILAVGGYYAIRPPRTRQVVAAPAQRSVATGLPATS